MGTGDMWGHHRNARATSGFAGPSSIGFWGNTPSYPMGWCRVTALFSGNLWHTTASKIRAAHQLCFILLATGPSLQSAAPFLIVTSRAPFRDCLKANIGLLIGYINALNYGEEEERGGGKSLAHTSLQKFQSLEESDPETKALWISPLPCSPCLAPPSLPSLLLPPLRSNSANLSDTFSCQLPRYFPLNVTWQQLAATFELLYMSYAKKKKKKQLKYNDYWNTRFETKSGCFQWGARGNLF